MSPSELSPLINGDGRRLQSPSFYHKILALLKAEGEPSWLDSFRWFVFGSWPNLLLLLVPVAAASHFLDWDAPLRFGFCFIAIIPLAKVRTCSEPRTT
jgi:Ca2+:H+ antiporter